MIQHYSRDFYLGNEDKTIDELNMTLDAAKHSGTAWNRLIGGIITDQLHERILDVPSSQLISFLNILVLINSGWLYTAYQMVCQLELPDLEDTVDWLKTALLEGDDTTGTAS